MKITEQQSLQRYSDVEIIHKILQTEPELYEELIRRYNSLLYKIGRTYSYNHQDTEDLMQETFINCYQSLSTFENRSSFKTWIVKIMIHQCYHKAHKKK
ncbi:MAG TPA: sigma-70 family RNA polymerase sigma factor, partial [Hanamia sp.]|nr:sigma-70 family RNA polymerase sigma factor [Hanamia sp.]